MFTDEMICGENATESKSLGTNNLKSVGLQNRRSQAHKANSSSIHSQ